MPGVEGPATNNTIPPGSASDQTSVLEIKLDSVRQEDLASLTEWMNDIEYLGLWTARRKQLLYEDLEEFIRGRCRAGLFTVIRKVETGEPIGFLDGTMYERDGVAHFEIYLPPGSRRRGAILGAGRFIRFLFTNYPLRKLYCQAYAYNSASLSALRSAGFTHEGTLKELVWWDDRYWDVYIYALDRKAWEAGQVSEGRMGRIRRLVQQLRDGRETAEATNVADATDSDDLGLRKGLDTNAFGAAD